MKKIKIALIALCASVMFYTTSCTRIEPTEAGFKISKSGSYRGIDSLPLITGYQFFLPWATTIVTIPTTQQHIVWTISGDEGDDADKNQEISVSCLGGAGFNMNVGFNYHVDASKASKVYLRYKTDDLKVITKTYLRNLVRKSMQDVSSTITVDSLLNNLSGYENAVAANLTKALAVQGFDVDNFNVISKPTPSDPQLAAAINRKIQAKQDAETSKMQLQISIAESNKKIATARGDSAAKVIEAAGQAEAISKLQRQLTPEYVEYQKIQKWDGALPTVSGGGAGMILQLSTPNHK